MSAEFKLSLPLAHIALDRDYLTREMPNLFTELWKNPDTLVLPMHKQQVPLVGGTELKLVAPEAIAKQQTLVYLGKDLETQAPIVLAILDEPAAVEFDGDPNSWHTLRRSGIGLSPRDAAIFTQALALANWHETHEYCSACGTLTLIERAGWMRRCPSDNRELFPRTDPAVIVGVIDSKDRLLLGSQGSWEDNRFSVLAGFVEPGESLDAAVIREMQEEAGILVANPTFLGSQSWPYPYSLMLGFVAQHLSGAITPDGEEIVKLRWFTRDELKAEASRLLLPGKLSIARAIIEHWLGEELKTGE